ncbi:hypothetical protein Tsubulata_027536 [Turnera subulata]|uniref:CNNM transmembrane domain-containing protein n=1 Tax=Turnera subulata TaxID=218843 RepID=A0A9Q0FRT4_9ROSI|nr:hypothetical protein Tsubulata_027536 [Turnera subulata]
MAADVGCCHTEFWMYLMAIAGLVSFAGLMAGLTLGLMSLGLVDLEVLIKSGRPQDRIHASKIFPVVKNQHLLLCTLLIGNSLAMEALPICLDKLVPPWAAILISVTLVLMFGEILPQAVCTRYGLTVGATMAPLVRVLLLLFFPISYPISKVLDWMLGKGHAVLLRRAELKTFVNFHGNEAGKGGDLTHDETTIITGALELTEKTAKDAMTPISKAFSLDLDATLNLWVCGFLDTLNNVMTMGHSRVPVYAGNPTNIIGLVLKGHSHIAVVYKDLNSSRNRRLLEFKDSCRKQRGQTEASSGKSDDKTSPTAAKNMKATMESNEAQPAASSNDGGQKRKSPPSTPAFKKRHRGCAFCILDIENFPIPEFPSNEEVVGVITMEDVIEELLQEEILDETDEYVNIHNKIKINMHASQEKASNSTLEPSGTSVTGTASPTSAPSTGPTPTLSVSAGTSLSSSPTSSNQVSERDLYGAVVRKRKTLLPQHMDTNKQRKQTSSAWKPHNQQLLLRHRTIEMAIARLARQAKRPHGLCVKMTAVAIMGLCFIFVWSMFSSSSSSVATQRESFDEISEPVPANTKASNTRIPSNAKHEASTRADPDLKKNDETKNNGSATIAISHHQSGRKDRKEAPHVRREKDRAKKLPKGIAKDNDVEEEEPGSEESETEDGQEGEVVDGREEANDGETEGNGDNEGDGDLVETVDQENVEKVEDESGGGLPSTGKKRKVKGPVFDPKAHYSWKLCSTRSKHNYIPCIDMESGSVRVQSYRHTERSCPKAPPMCLVPLPIDGYGPPVPWPESKLKILYKNVAHPKLATFIKKNTWLVMSDEHLTFPQNQSEIKGGVQHYLEFIEEMVPDIEWGKNIRVVLDIGAKDSSFGSSLLDKDVLTLSLGLKDDLVDLAQVALERGFPTIVSPFGHRRLPFPSGAFDTIHCGGCSIAWHANDLEDTLFCQLTMIMLRRKKKPDSNDIYELRRKKNPPLCKENENPDAAWYVPMKLCLHSIPSSIEQHGAEWPEEWPKRLETYPDWMNGKEKLVADTNHWRAIVDKSYLTGIGIDWSRIRNVMDMKAINGGFAAALSQQKSVWVMNVIPVHAPDTLPIIYERGLIGVYHDWCESFGTYPRSYDLLHADHLFSRLKNRCKQPVAIVVEMDRMLRPNGWVIARDKVEILEPLEGILRSLHWEIRMTYYQDKEGILCAQKTMWRP